MEVVVALTAMLMAAFLGEFAVAAPEDGERKAEQMVLFDFTASDAPWRIIDDGVMGGTSQGAWRVADGKGVFAGNLSLENNGGFSSVRSQSIDVDCTGGTAFRIRVKGDGRCYQFRVRTTEAFDGPIYRLHFDTIEDEWKEIELPLADFEASFRGRVLTGRPPLAGKDVVTVGFLLADKKAGPFRLEVDWIAMVKPSD